MQIKNLTKNDLLALVDLHYLVLPNEFLTSISKPFLLGFYQNLFSSPYSRFLGAFESPNNPNNPNLPNSRLVAAIIGLEENYKPKLNSYLLLFMKNLPAFFTSPKSLILLFQSFLFKIGQPQETEIFFIGVTPKFQGQGLGRKLIATLEKSLLSEYKNISVDCKTKLPSNNFYKKCGFELQKTFKLYNENWNRYEKEI